MLEAVITTLIPKLPDLLAIFGGLIASPIMGVIKKLFGAETKTEDVLADLAQLKPEAMTAFVNALCQLKESDIKFFNRDIVGTIHTSISSLRAAIRPITVAFALICLMLDGFGLITIREAIRLSFEAWVSSWMGDRFMLK